MRRRKPDAKPEDIARDIKTIKECLTIARRHTRNTPLLRKKILSAIKSADGAVRHLRSYTPTLEARL